MSKITYIERNFQPASLAIIRQAESICNDYARQGYDLTLRQLYYQFVSKALIPNKDSEYDRLGSIINDARLAGYIDWNHISDRTRNLSSTLHFDDPADRIQHAAKAYQIDKWEGQQYRVEVWVEKEALAGVISQVARRWDCPYFSCRGYVSQSEMHAAGRRLAGYIGNGQCPVIIHLGDHDPSGIDMTRDIEDRLRLFMTEGFYGVDDAEEFDWIKSEIDLTVDRIALNMDQIRRFNPPPNPAKLTDSRGSGYVAKYGNSSWELDALSPAQLDQFISESIQQYLDGDKWNVLVQRETAERDALIATAGRWQDVERYIKSE